MDLEQTPNGGGAHAGAPELVVHYPALIVRPGIGTVIVGLASISVGGLTAGVLWLLFLCANQLLVLAGWGWGNLLLVQHETSWLPVAGAGLVLLPTALLFSWFCLLVAVHSVRKARRAWWLRLTSKGFEVNDGVFTARRFEWHEVEKFMLVAPAADIEQAVVTPGTTFTEVFTQRGSQSAAFRVGFRGSPRRRRRLARKMCSGLRGRDGTRVDGLVMGYWDRPFDEAVVLMNQWHTRYKAA